MKGDMLEERYEFKRETAEPLITNYNTTTDDMNF